MAIKALGHLTGLCSFIPDRPIDKPNNAAFVLLVNARQSSHESHYSVILFDARDQGSVAIPTRPRDFRFFSRQFDIEVAACILNGEEISIEGFRNDNTFVPLPTDALKFVTGKKKPGQVCPTAGDGDDFAWVVDMGRFRAGPIKSNLLTAKDVDTISGRFRLTTGELRNGGFRAAGSGIVKWRTVGPHPNAAISEEVEWSFTVPDSNVIGLAFRSTTFVGTPPPPLVLIPHTGNAVEFAIVNMPLPDILEQRKDPLATDHHFEEFYRLHGGTPVPKIVPSPQSADCPPVVGVSNPKCPPTQFDPLGA